jgi:hypothetical protein
LPWRWRYEYDDIDEVGIVERRRRSIERIQQLDEVLSDRRLLPRD